MKSIKELLVNKTGKDLINICRKFELTGYSKLRIDGLINLIAENLANPQVQEKIKSIVKKNETTALILKNLMDNNNEISYTVLRQEILKNKSSSAFRGYFKQLVDSYIIFEDEQSEDDLIYLPEDFNEISTNIIGTHIQDEIEEESEEEEKNISRIEQIFYSKKYTSIESLRELLAASNQPTTGNKSQMIDRLLNESGIPIKDIANSLLGKIELKEISRELNLPVSGTKEILVENILNKFELTTEKKAEPVKEAKKAPAKAMASSRAEKKVQTKEIELPKESSKDLVFNLLEQIPLTIAIIKNLETLVPSITTALKSFILVSPEYKGIIVREGEKKSKEPNLILEKEGDKFGISIWYFEDSSKKSIMNLKSDLFDFHDKYGDNLILYIYDPNNKLNQDDLESFKRKFHLVYKTKRDFEQ